MNYQKIYDLICIRGKEKRQLDYSETHHIIPKCMGGSDNGDNLTVLTAKEHFIVHLLLTKLYKGNKSIQYAYCMLSVKNKYQHRIVTSKHYEASRLIRSKIMKENNPMKKDEVVRKMSDTRKKLFSEGKLPNPMDFAEARKKVSENMKVNNPMTRFPERNHTVKRTIVYYEDGSILEFQMKKDFMDTLVGLTHMQKRYKIDKNDLKEFGIIKVERIGKQ